MRRLCAVLAALLMLMLLPAAGGVGAQDLGDPPEDFTITRLAGDNRVTTAVAVSQEGWDSSPVVLVASADSFPDALAGGALAADLDAPVLLTQPDALTAATAEEITRLGATSAIVLGGTAAVSEAVAEDLTDAGLTVDRIAGADRYDTAAQIATRLAPFPEAALVNGEMFADALSAGALAAGPEPVPTLLTRPDDLPDATAAVLRDAGVLEVDIVGGEVVVSATVAEVVQSSGVRVNRLGGPDRYATSALVAGEALSRMTDTTVPLVMATGDAFPDALAAGPFAARTSGLLLLTPGQGISGTSARLVGLSATRFSQAYLVGGEAAISDDAGIAQAMSDGLTASQRDATVDGPAGSAAAATVEPLATQTALQVLADGGNAIDATIAAAAVLGVAEPFSSGIGGGGFMVIRSAAQNRVITIDGREEAPQGYFPTVFIDPDTGEAIPFPERVTSGLGVGVPGTVDTWRVALENYGTRTMEDLLGPAIEAADYGIPIDSTLAAQTAANAERFALFDSTSALYLPHDGQPRLEGEWFRNPDLAQTYREIGAGGAAAFYQGQLAQEIVAAVTAPPLVSDDTPVPVRPGLMTASDLGDYQALLQQPTVSSYRGLDVYGMGLPSSGGLTIGLALNQIQALDDTLGPIAPGDEEELAHRYLESLGVAWADRNAYMGDRRYVDVPEDGLLNPDYAAERAGLIGETAGARPVAPGDPFAFSDDPSPSGPITPGFTTHLSGSTTHLNVSDAFGNVVSYTFTIESIGGSGIVVPGRGFLLNNELTDFNAEPPHANAPEAGKRPRSSMSPTIVMDGDNVVLSLGTPGGATIISTVLQTLLGVVDGGHSLADALAAPRFANFNGEMSVAEPEFLTTDLAAALEARGHVFREIGEIGAASGIQFNADGTVTAVAEPVRRGAGDAGVILPSP
ncbi:MAG: gamma-glutamyltransferase [Euzebya sp.]